MLLITLEAYCVLYTIDYLVDSFIVIVCFVPKLFEPLTESCPFTIYDLLSNPISSLHAIVGAYRGHRVSHPLVLALSSLVPVRVPLIYHLPRKPPHQQLHFCP